MHIWFFFLLWFLRREQRLQFRRDWNKMILQGRVKEPSGFHAFLFANEHFGSWLKSCTWRCSHIWIHKIEVTVSVTWVCSENLARHVTGNSWNSAWQSSGKHYIFKTKDRSLAHGDIHGGLESRYVYVHSAWRTRRYTSVLQNRQTDRRWQDLTHVLGFSVPASWHSAARNATSERASGCSASALPHCREGSATGGRNEWGERSRWWLPLPTWAQIHAGGNLRVSDPERPGCWGSKCAINPGTGDVLQEALWPLKIMEHPRNACGALWA